MIIVWGRIHPRPTIVGWGVLLLLDKKEMSDQDHEILLNQLLKHSGPVLLSGYHSNLYDSMLADWDYIEISAYAQSLEKKTEVLWANYSIKEKIDENKYSQMSFV